MLGVPCQTHVSWRSNSGCEGVRAGEVATEKTGLLMTASLVFKCSRLDTAASVHAAEEGS